MPFTSARVVPHRISPVITSSTLIGVAMIDSYVPCISSRT